ncbi:unnamed protein product [Schistocephalus solidus]|uniref:ENTH domain-containing protein n=1 Tax=Schistocephalus solidus TaxID=70667 RepID=A0A183SGI8_SCHSO|nr:unnamed protein product [Schistocephalus solidus]
MMPLQRHIKNVVHNYSDVERKVREATSNDPWGPSSTLMSEIADQTYHVIPFTEIMQMIWKRLNDKNKNWRHVYKALTLLEYIIKTGSENVARQCQENIHAIETLMDFYYVDEGKDVGRHVREKAYAVNTLLRDKERLQEERKKAQLARSRLERGGFGATTGSLGGVGDGSYAGLSPQASTRRPLSATERRPSSQPSLSGALRIFVVLILVGISSVLRLKRCLLLPIPFDYAVDQILAMTLTDLYKCGGMLRGGSGRASHLPPPVMKNKFMHKSPSLHHPSVEHMVDIVGLRRLNYRTAPDIESALPQSYGEEELQLQLALAISREEHEQEMRKRQEEEAKEALKLQMVLEQSKREEQNRSAMAAAQETLVSTTATSVATAVTNPATAPGGGLFNLIDTSLSAAPANAPDPWTPVALPISPPPNSQPRNVHLPHHSQSFALEGRSSVAAAATAPPSNALTLLDDAWTPRSAFIYLSFSCYPHPPFPALLPPSSLSSAFPLSFSFPSLFTPILFSPLSFSQYLTCSFPLHFFPMPSTQLQPPPYAFQSPEPPLPNPLLIVPPNHTTLFRSLAFRSISSSQSSFPLPNLFINASKFTFAHLSDPPAQSVEKDINPWASLDPLLTSAPGTTNGLHPSPLHNGTSLCLSATPATALGDGSCANTSSAAANANECCTSRKRDPADFLGEHKDLVDLEKLVDRAPCKIYSSPQSLCDPSTAIHFFPASTNPFAVASRSPTLTNTNPFSANLPPKPSLNELTMGATGPAPLALTMGPANSAFAVPAPQLRQNFGIFPAAAPGVSASGGFGYQPTAAASAAAFQPKPYGQFGQQQQQQHQSSLNPFT